MNFAPVTRGVLKAGLAVSALLVLTGSAAAQASRFVINEANALNLINGVKANVKTSIDKLDFKNIVTDAQLETAINNQRLQNLNPVLDAAASISDSTVKKHVESENRSHKPMELVLSDQPWKLKGVKPYFDSIKKDGSATTLGMNVVLCWGPDLEISANYLCDKIRSFTGLSGFRSNLDFLTWANANPKSLAAYCLADTLKKDDSVATIAEVYKASNSFADKRLAYGGMDINRVEIQKWFTDAVNNPNKQASAAFAQDIFGLGRAPPPLNASGIRKSQNPGGRGQKTL